MNVDGLDDAIAPTVAARNSVPPDYVGVPPDAAEDHARGHVDTADHPGTLDHPDTVEGVGATRTIDEDGTAQRSPVGRPAVTATLRYTLRCAEKDDPEGWSRWHRVDSVAWGRRTHGTPLLATSGVGSATAVWDGASGARLATLAGHTGSGRSPAWARHTDGTLLLADCDYHTLGIWDPFTGTQLFILRRTKWLDSVAYTQRDDGTLLLATAHTSYHVHLENKYKAVVWEAALPPGRTRRSRFRSRAARLATLVAHTDRIGAIAWAQRGDGAPLLATGSNDGTACVWDGTSGTRLAVLHTGPVRTLAWAQRDDGTLLLATGGGSGAAMIWDGVSGAPFASLDGHARVVNAMAWTQHADGTLLLATGSGDGTAAVWDGTSGTRLATMDGHTRQVNAVAWARRTDGTLLLATGSEDGTAAVWDGTSGTRLATIPHPHAVAAVAFTDGPGGRFLLATGCADRHARIIDVDAEPTEAEPAPHPGQAHTSPPATTVPTPDLGPSARTGLGHPDPASARGTAPARPDQRLSLEGPIIFLPASRAVAWARQPDGTLLLATKTWTYTAAVWDGTAGTRLAAMDGHTDQVNAVAWARRADGSLLLATGSHDGTAAVWDTATGTRLTTFRTGNPVTSVAWARQADGSLLLATAIDSSLVDDNGDYHRQHEIMGWRVALPIAADDQPAAEPDRTRSTRGRLGRTPSAQHPEPTVTVWRTNWFDQHTGNITSMACARRPDGILLLASGSEDGTAVVRKVETGIQPVTSPGHMSYTSGGTRLAMLDGHTGPVHSVAWARQPDETLLLATGSEDSTAAVWDIATGARLATLSGHTGPVQSVAWARRVDGTLLLATGSDDGTAAVWNPDTGARLATLSGYIDGVTSVAWARRVDGSLLLAAGGSPSTRIYAA